MGGELFDITYDGKGIGSFQADRFQGHWHKELIIDITTVKWILAFMNGIERNGITTAYEGSGISIGNPFNDGINGLPRTGFETNPACISFFACISY